MRPLAALWSSSVGKKQVVALTGLGLLGFLIAHLSGNLAMLKGGGAFDAYAEFLTSNPLIIPAEVGLVLLFLCHIVFGVRVTWENWRARPEGYAVSASAGGRTVGSATMVYTGLLTLAFLCLHVVSFKFNHPAGTSLFDWVIAGFHDPLYMGAYVAAMFFLGLHLSHGVGSAFQTFGLHHPVYTPLIEVGGAVLAVVLAVGFGLLPLWGHLR